MIGKLRFRLGLAGLYGEIGFRGCNGLQMRLTGNEFLGEIQDFVFALVVRSGKPVLLYIWPYVLLFVNTVLKDGGFLKKTVKIFGKRGLVLYVCGRIGNYDMDDVRNHGSCDS